MRDRSQIAKATQSMMQIHKKLTRDSLSTLTEWPSPLLSVKEKLVFMCELGLSFSFESPSLAFFNDCL